MNKSIRIEKPGSLNGVDFLKDIFKVVKKTDEENWSYFGEEGERDFAVKFLKYGELTRLIYVGNKPVAYISCFLLKPNGHTLLKDDYYKSLGLGLYDLLISYDGTKRSYRRNSLYINVIAVVEEYQGNVSILKAIAKALYNIIECDLFYTRSSIGYLCPYKIYAVAVTNNGARMCNFFGFNLIGSSTRIVNELETERMLYGVNVDSFIIKLRKIVL